MIYSLIYMGASLVALGLRLVLKESALDSLFFGTPMVGFGAVCIARGGRGAGQ